MHMHALGNNRDSDVNLQKVKKVSHICFKFNYQIIFNFSSLSLSIFVYTIKGAWRPALRWRCKNRRKVKTMMEMKRNSLFSDRFLGKMGAPEVKWGICRHGSLDSPPCELSSVIAWRDLRVDFVVGVRFSIDLYIFGIFLLVFLFFNWFLRGFLGNIEEEESGEYSSFRDLGIRH